MRSSGPVLAFWGRISLTAAKFLQRCFTAPFAVWSKTLTQNESDDDDASKGETHRCLKLTSDWTETGNLEHIQRWSFSWELIAHARTSSLSHRQIWGTPILLIVRPTYELPLLLLLLFINHGSVPWGKSTLWFHNYKIILFRAKCAKKGLSCHILKNDKSLDAIIYYEWPKWPISSI